MEESEGNPDELESTSPEDAFQFLHLRFLATQFCHTGALDELEELAGALPKTKKSKRILCKLRRYLTDAEELVSDSQRYTNAFCLNPHLSSEVITNLGTKVQENLQTLLQNRDDGTEDENNSNNSSAAGGSSSPKGKPKGKGKSSALASNGQVSGYMEYILNANIAALHPHTCNSHTFPRLLRPIPSFFPKKSRPASQAGPRDDDKGDGNGLGSGVEDHNDTSPTGTGEDNTDVSPAGDEVGIKVRT